MWGTLVAILGTTISPYLFFWQTGQEVEEEKRIGRTRIVDREGATKKDVRDSAQDVTVGMLFSNLVMYFIILTTAATLFKSGQTSIQSATDAAKAADRELDRIAPPVANGDQLVPDRLGDEDAVPVAGLHAPHRSHHGPGERDLRRRGGMGNRQVRVPRQEPSHDADRCAVHGFSLSGVEAHVF